MLLFNKDLGNLRHVAGVTLRPNILPLFSIL
jgi:hypothetical protein